MCASLEMNNPIIVERLESFEGLRSEWRELMDGCLEATIFQSFDWLASWWQYFGEHSRLCLLLARQNGVLVGVAPLMISRRRFLGLPVVKVLEFVGKGSLDYQDFLLLKTREKEALAALLGYLQKMHRDWHFAEFPEIPEFSPLNRLLSSAAKDAKLICYSELSSPCPYMNLPATWDDYLAQLSRNSRSNIRRKFKRMEGSGRVEFETVASSGNLRQAIDRFMALNDDRMRSMGAPPMSELYRIFHRDIVVKMSDCIVLSFLKLDGNDVAGIYGFDFNGRRYYYLIGWNSAYSGYSPGAVLIAKQIECAIAKGLNVYDFLRGGEAYKFSFASQKSFNRAYVVFVSRVPFGLFWVFKRLRALALLCSSPLRPLLRSVKK